MYGFDPGPGQPLDGAVRRRLYLFRHGAVDYIDGEGRWVADPDTVDLNARGQAEAEQMALAFTDVQLDRAACSGLPRTRQTAEIVLRERGLPVLEIPAFREIRPLDAGPDDEFDLLRDLAFAHWRAHEPDARFLGGERYGDFYARIVAAAEAFVVEADWTSAALFAHGGTNAAVLGWVTGIGMAAFGAFDQQTCCLNIIDFDVSQDDCRIVRRTVRALNLTVRDPLKSRRHASDLELLAERIKRLEPAA